ncbi:MAG: chemotaxis protein CheW [Thiohalomonadaceae bacterium]
MNATAQKQTAKITEARAAHDASRFVTFHLDAEKYGINVMQVREVLKVSEIAPVPGAPDFVLGIINLRGNVVTVIDTRQRFGLQPREMDDATRIVIIENGEQVVGIVVDSVAEVMNIPSAEIEMAPNVGNDESAKFIQGVSHQGEELVILIDHARLFSLE